MKLDRRYRLEGALSRDSLRTHITCAWLDVDAKCLLGTNGHFLAVVPVVVDKADRSGPVPAAAISAMRRKYAATTTARTGLIVMGDTLYRRGSTRHPAGTAEQRKAIVPTFKRGDAGVVSVAFSAAYLLKLAHAIGRGRNHDGVVLTFKPGELDGILVEPETLEDGGPFGVLMPRRYQ